MEKALTLRQRASGVLLHPTSLPGPHGIGDLGPEAFRFAEVLAACGQTWWQMLPISPVGAGYSPYASPSAFAGNPLLLSLQRLREDGLLEADLAQETSEARALGVEALSEVCPTLEVADEAAIDSALAALRQSMRL